MNTIKITPYKGIKLLLLALVLFCAKAKAQVVPFGMFHDGQTEAISYRDTTTDIVEVTSNTGKVWMDRNLGATRNAVSKTDTEAYGDLYQWGRSADGHQLRTSGRSYTSSSLYKPGHGDFILGSLNWYNGTSLVNSLWKEDGTGVNNPCPVGYRLPTQAELVEEYTSWGGSNKYSDKAYASPLEWVAGGYRIDTIELVGSVGYYWSSTTASNSTNSFRMIFSKYRVAMENYNRERGHSVRCIKE